MYICNMKRIIFLIAAIIVCGNLFAQEVFTLVYATSDDGFVNVRERPSSRAHVLTKLYMFNHGLGNGLYLGQNGNWTKVNVNGIIGWAYSKYVGKQKWYDGNGSPKLIATADNTPIYRESYVDNQEYDLFTWVKRGTILADNFEEQGEYYVLTSAHDYLFIKKAHAKVVR